MENLIKKILQDEKVVFTSLTKATSGFTNLVFFIDNKFVIKLSKDEVTRKKIDKEISIYKNINLNCIPRFIASGEMQGYKYLIITKVNGKSLYSIWHTLSETEREKSVEQIANILKAFNSYKYSFLNEEYIDKNWSEFILNELNVKTKTLKEMGFNTQKVDEFISKDLALIFNENQYGLVYNDAHFDNFIYDEGRLSLIDFDRVRACPIDFEMLIFKTMCDNPSKFASEEDEDNIEDEDYRQIYKQFKKAYPEMFTHKDVEKRIKVYQFNYLIGQAIKCKDSEWINELLNNF